MYKATAIVSIYNSDKFIRNKILNLLESAVPIKIILIDCTGGKELKLVENITNTPQFVKVIINERISVWAAMNLGIRLADTPYVVQANTDDYVHPNGYKAQVEKMDEGSDIAYFDYKLSAYKPTWQEGYKAAHDYYKCSDEGYSPGNGLGPFPMWRKSLHDEFGFFEERLEIYGDALFWTKLAAGDISWGHIPKFLGIYANRQSSLERNAKYRVKDKKTMKKLKNDPY
tara:strand:+ start:57892 stop:58575 length:684 start_codon:yes stop_codon:yes gene_type:complete